MTHRNACCESIETLQMYTTAFCKWHLHNMKTLSIFRYRALAVSFLLQASIIFSVNVGFLLFSSELNLIFWNNLAVVAYILSISFPIELSRLTDRWLCGNTDFFHGSFRSCLVVTWFYPEPFWRTTSSWEIWDSSYIKYFCQIRC